MNKMVAALQIIHQGDQIIHSFLVLVQGGWIGGSRTEDSK